MLAFVRDIRFLKFWNEVSFQVPKWHLFVKKWSFWPIFDSLFSYKSAKNGNKINLASRTEEACLMNIQFKNQLDSPNTFLVIVVTVSKKIVLRKTRLEFSAWFIMKKRLTTSLQHQSRTVLPDYEFSIVHRFEKCKNKKMRFFGTHKVKVSLKKL